MEKKYNEILERANRGEWITEAESDFIDQCHYEDCREKINNLHNEKGGN
jgi:hypothetical protein